MTTENQISKRQKVRKVSLAEASFIGAVQTLQNMGFSKEEVAEVFGGKPKPKSTETKQKGSTQNTKPN